MAEGTRRLHSASTREENGRGADISVMQMNADKNAGEAARYYSFLLLMALPCRAQTSAG